MRTGIMQQRESERCFPLSRKMNRKYSMIENTTWFEVAILSGLLLQLSCMFTISADSGVLILWNWHLSVTDCWCVDHWNIFCCQTSLQPYWSYLTWHHLSTKYITMVKCFILFFYVDPDILFLICRLLAALFFLVTLGFSPMSMVEKRWISGFGVSAILHVTHPLAITSGNKLIQCAGGKHVGMVGGDEVRRGLGVWKEGLEDSFSSVLSLQISKSIASSR